MLEAVLGDIRSRVTLGGVQKPEQGPLSTPSAPGELNQGFGQAGYKDNKDSWFFNCDDRNAYFIDRFLYSIEDEDRLEKLGRTTLLVPDISPFKPHFLCYGVASLFQVCFSPFFHTNVVKSFRTDEIVLNNVGAGLHRKWCAACASHKPYQEYCDTDGCTHVLRGF